MMFDRTVLEPKALEPTMIEIASGVILGQVPEVGPPRPLDSTAPHSNASALSAIEFAILPALARPPCLVSFSGGMDSSFILAVASRVARRHGLAAPIPVTWRFTNAPRAQESAWQDRVVTDLGIGDWQILTADDDLDLIGAVARRQLTRHGVRHPVNSHLHLPLLELAAGGSLLTGWGGDQVLAGWRRPQRRARPTMSRSVRDHLPHSLAAVVIQRRRDPFPWLRASISRELIRGGRSERHAEPMALTERIDWHVRRRDVLMASASLAAIAADNDVQLIHPLLDRGFVTSLGRQLTGRPWLSRSEILTAITGGQLPEVATAFRPKAHFLEVFLREPTREFARSWSGQGVDTTIVNPAVLQRLWSRWPIPGNTAGLIQQLWLRSVSSDGGPIPPAG